MATENDDFAETSHGIGRPTKYRQDFAQKAREMCERGATNADLASEFEVALSTIWLWQTTHAEFFECCKTGKAAFDERVKSSFYMRCTGYEYLAQKVASNDGIPTVVEFREHVPADVSAAKFWLINRCPDEFKPDTKVSFEHSTKKDDPLATFLDSLAGRGKTLQPVDEPQPTGQQRHEEDSDDEPGPRF